MMSIEVSDIEPERIILNFSAVLKASKRIAYRDSMREMFTAFIIFLQDNNLLNSIVIQPGMPLSDQTIVRRGDMKDDAVKLFFAAWEKWAILLDKGTPIGDMSFLKNELRKIQERSINR